MISLGRSVGGASLFTACLFLGACDDSVFASFDRVKQDFHNTYPLNAGGTFSLESFNGSIEVYGWDENKVEVSGVKYASSQMLLDAIRIDTQASPGSVHIRASHPTTWHGSAGARFVIHVPRKIRLDPIESSNGSIRVDGIEGSERLRTSNGTIRVNQARGDLDAHTSNGSVEIVGLEGDASVRTSNGAIRAEASHGHFQAETSNGSINARLTDASGGPVRLHSSNGHIDLVLEGSKLPEVRADTSNSSLTVRMPASANADVRAHTSHSSITTDFDVLMHGGSRSHSDLEGTIGKGGPVIDLSSSNGSIKILRGGV